MGSSSRLPKDWNLSLQDGCYNGFVTKVISKVVNRKELKELAVEIGGFYIKVVVDLGRGLMAAGAKMHVDEERALIEDGSNQEDLWGGGYDLDTEQITFDSIINNKPGVNASSDILDPEVRRKFEVRVKKLLGL